MCRAPSTRNSKPLSSETSNHQRRDRKEKHEKEAIEEEQGRKQLLVGQCQQTTHHQYATVLPVPDYGTIQVPIMRDEPGPTTRLLLHG